MTCVISFNKNRYGQKFTKTISDVFSISMMPNTNKLVIQVDRDGAITKETFDVNDTLKIEVSAEELM